MKKTIQILIMEIMYYISVRGPYNPEKNKEFKLLHGKYDKDEERWLLPKDAASWRKLNELYGAESGNVIVRVTPKDLTTVGEQVQLGGYVVAHWDNRHNRIRLPDGVELVAGNWDEVASKAKETPCFSGLEVAIHIVVRRDFADKRGLTVVEEVPEEKTVNPFAGYADSDLITELKNRGYRVERSCF